MADFVHHTCTAGVMTITLDRPDLHNAFNEVVIDEITAAFEHAATAPGVRVVVFRSTGKSFCAGADIHWMKRMVGYGFDDNVADAATMCRMLQAIRACPRPVIARVHGAAYGGGVGLIAACDMVGALASARFCLSEVKLGIVPAVISPFVLEKIGIGHARRYALTAEVFSGSEARRIGLVSEVADTAEQLDAWIADVTRLLMNNGPEALGVCKQILSAVAGQDWQAAEQMTTRTIAERRVSVEGQDGLKAFLEKRSPSWMAD